MFVSTDNQINYPYAQVRKENRDEGIREEGVYLFILFYLLLFFLMKLETYNWDNYYAQVVSLPEIRNVEGLDNLWVVTIFGYNCLVGKDSPTWEFNKYLFFPAESVLSKEFLRRNNLYRETSYNLDNTKKGFFEPSGRVKAIKFKGIVSSGFVIGISSLHSFCDINKLNKWDTFNRIDWEEICKKFTKPLPKTNDWKSKAIRRIEKFDIIIPNQFRFHADTPQFLRFLSDFKEGDRIVITEKFHGTSAVYSNVMTRTKMRPIERVARWLWVRVKDTEYYQLYSSRKVIKNSEIKDEKNGAHGFYWEDVWGKWAKALEGKIEKGITLYWEIVGYTESGKQIQSWYNYGCKYWESKFYCYRITYTTPDGNVIEFTDSQIRQYCKLREIEVVPLIEWFTWSEFTKYKDFALWLGIEEMCSMNDKKVPREWVVIRKDGKETYSAYKLKSQLFLLHESKVIDEGGEDLESNS